MGKSISSQIDALVKSLSSEAHEKAEPMLADAMLPMLQQMYDELSGYEPLTGNTNNSLAVALYRDGQLMTAMNVRRLSGVARPTRMTMRDGEWYELPMRWSGNPSHHEGNRWVGDESFWADEEAIRFLETQSPSHKGYSYKFVAAIDYAKYLEANGKINVLTAWHDDLASAGAIVSPMNSSL